MNIFFFCLLIMYAKRFIIFIFILFSDYVICQQITPVARIDDSVNWNSIHEGTGLESCCPVQMKIQVIPDLMKLISANWLV